MAFHILGLDILIDDSYEPILLEVNHTPSFATETPLDHRIKTSLIKDTLVLMRSHDVKLKK
jgi:tubulin polyglutamylase TTLL6/13